MNINYDDSSRLVAKIIRGASPQIFTPENFSPDQETKAVNKVEFDNIVEQARLRQDGLLTVKGHDYTRGDADRLANFKNNAKGLGLTPQQVWAVYFMKHIDAIMSYVKTGKLESEALTGRLDDAINYLYLFEALVKDLEAQDK